MEERRQSGEELKHPTKAKIHSLKFFVTYDFHKLLLGKIKSEGDQDLSHFLRRIICKESNSNPMVIHQVKLSINKIGLEINQLAKHLHKKSQVDVLALEDMKKYKIEMESIDILLRSWINESEIFAQNAVPEILTNTSMPSNKSRTYAAPLSKKDKLDFKHSCEAKYLITKSLMFGTHTKKSGFLRLLAAFTPPPEKRIHFRFDDRTRIRLVQKMAMWEHNNVSGFLRLIASGDESLCRPSFRAIAWEISKIINNLDQLKRYIKPQNPVHVMLVAESDKLKSAMNDVHVTLNQWMRST